MKKYFLKTFAAFLGSIILGGLFGLIPTSGLYYEYPSTYLWYVADFLEDHETSSYEYMGKMYTDQKFYDESLLKYFNSDFPQDLVEHPLIEYFRSSSPLYNGMTYSEIIDSFKNNSEAKKKLYKSFVNEYYPEADINKVKMLLHKKYGNPFEETFEQIRFKVNKVVIERKYGSPFYKNVIPKDSFKFKRKLIYSFDLEHFKHYGLIVCGILFLFSLFIVTIQELKQLKQN